MVKETVSRLVYVDDLVVGVSAERCRAEIWLYRPCPAALTDPPRGWIDGYLRLWPQSIEYLLVDYCRFWPPPAPACGATVGQYGLQRYARRERGSVLVEVRALSETELNDIARRIQRLVG